MGWQVTDDRNIQCAPVAANSFSASDNTSTTPIAVGFVPGTTDNVVDYPKPKVAKADGDSYLIYGKFVVYDEAVGEVTVATGGIQSFEKESASVAADIGKGIIGGGTAGKVDIGTGVSRGCVVARSGTTLWVDLDATPVTLA